MKYWIFENGDFKEGIHEDWITKDFDNFDDFIWKEKYTPLDTIGDEDGMHLTYYQKEPERLLVCFSTIDYWYPIFAYSLPDFIKLLNILIPIVMSRPEHLKDNERV